jgi:nucleoside-diphosphate-sugar epimerase
MGLEYWRDRRVLVTGGAGFIGSHVAEALTAAGARVTIAARFRNRSYSYVDHLRGHVELVSGDLREGSFAGVCTRDKDAILHFASKIGGLRYNAQHAAEMLTYNTLLDLQVLSAAAQNRTPLFLYVSGALVYDATAPVPTKEGDSVSGPPADACKGAAWAKRIGETAVDYVREEYGVPVTVARLSNVYGPRDDFRQETAHLIGNTIRLVVEGRSPEIWGDGAHTRSYLYVTDAVRALLLVAELGPNRGPINICGQHEYTVREIVHCVVETAGAAVDVVLRPGPCGASRRRLDTSKLRALTGFEEAVELRDGIRRTLEWFRENRWKLNL